MLDILIRGSKLNISKTVDWATLLTVVLNNVVTLSKTHETMVGDGYYSYYCLKAFQNIDLFKALIKYFLNKQKVIYCRFSSMLNTHCFKSLIKF